MPRARRLEAVAMGDVLAGRRRWIADAGDEKIRAHEIRRVLQIISTVAAEIVNASLALTGE